MHTSSQNVPALVTYGDPRLRQKAVPVACFDEALRRLADAMVALMHLKGGVGLAAEQADGSAGRSDGPSRALPALCVIDVPEDARAECVIPGVPFPPMPLVLVNPRIVASAGSDTSSEGCLSFPEIYAPVKRAAEVTVEYQDLEGRAHSLRAAGLFARAVQHEVDHLHGVLLVDRMSAVKRISLAGTLKKLRLQTQQERAA